MAKKLKQPQSPKEWAAANAARLAELNEQADAIKIEQDSLKTALRSYVIDTGDKALGAMVAYEKANPVSIESSGLTTKELDYAKLQLANELPDFTKTSLDLTKMYAAVKTNHHLANALEAKGLSLTQKTEIQFKLAKAA